VDENLTPGLVKFARSCGFHAVHVNEENLTSLGDSYVARYALDRGMILVTANVVDFKRVYAES
jgi:predicted nuclease of predicted toxin-antitoxin system